VVRGTNIYIFGGDTGKQRVDNALYVLDTTTFTFRRFDLPGAPAPRSFHVCERIGKYMFVFGGMLGGGLSYVRLFFFFCLPLVLSLYLSLLYLSFLFLHSHLLH
jgi:hypothetical protein